MKSLSDIQIVFKLLGVRLRVGEWYIIHLWDDDYIWVAKYYRFKDNCFIHLDDCYLVNPKNGNYSTYPPKNGIFHSLCGFSEIESIELVKEDYVLSLGIEI